MPQNFNSSLEWHGCRPESVGETNDGWVEAVWEVGPGQAFSTTCRIVLPESPSPFWCIPGLFWGDSLQDTTAQYYPRFDATLKKPEKFRSPYWEFDVWRAAQPVVAVHDGLGWTILEISPSVCCGVSQLKPGIGFEYVNGTPVLLASLPANERPYRPVGHDYTSPVQGFHKPDAPEKVSWLVRVIRAGGGRDAILEFLSARYHASGKSASLRKEAPDFALATRNALMKWHHDPARKTFRYTVAFDRVGQQIAEGGGGSLDRHEMPMGWVSGWVVFQALAEWAARRDDPAALAAVMESWKQIQQAGLVSPSGFWWTRYVPPGTGGKTIFDARLPGNMDGNWMPDPHHLHLRTLGDAVWRAARTLRLHREALPCAAELHDQILGQSEKILKLAEQGWPLPLSVDARTGEPAGLHGTAAMIWISVWCELARMGDGGNTDLILAGLDHYRGAVESGDLCGAPEDVGECITSEDIYIAVNAYLDGYRLLGRKEDLATCLKAAEWLYLWRKSFHHHLDPRTIVGVYGLTSRGGDLASFKNNHLHIYGLDIDASLRELAELTGDARWRELADDHWAFASQLVPLVDGQFNAYEGMVTEQFYFIDWSALGNSVRLIEDDERRASYDVGPHYRNHGNLAGFSHAWCTAFVLKTALERGPSARAHL